MTDAKEQTIQPTSAAGPRVLIIRPSALGDVCRTVPALVSLRNHFGPGATIDWLVQDGFIAAIDQHPALDQVVSFGRQAMKGAAYRPAAARRAIGFLRRLKDSRYDLVIDLQGLARSGMFTWATRAQKRVGAANARELAWLGYNMRCNVPPNLHAVDHMLALIECAGVKPVDDMTLYTSPEDDRWVNENIGDAPYVCIAPTARWLCKCWPIEKYAQIAARIVNEGIAERLVVLASPRERQQVQPMLDALGSSVPVAMPQTTVGQLMSVIKQCSAIVCNDSAPLHMAVGFCKPIAAVFGPTDPRLVGPYKRDDAVVQPANLGDALRTDYRHQRDDQTLISQVTVDDVWNCLTKQVDQSLAR